MDGCADQCVVVGMCVGCVGLAGALVWLVFIFIFVCFLGGFYGTIGLVSFYFLLVVLCGSACSGVIYFFCWVCFTLGIVVLGLVNVLIKFGVCCWTRGWLVLGFAFPCGWC